MNAANPKDGSPVAGSISLEGGGASSTHDPARRVVAWGVLVAAVAYFAVRGIWRALQQSGDLKFGYASAQALLRGLDPYDPRYAQQVLVAGGGDMANVVAGFHNVFFPTTLPLFIPISLGTWAQAQWLGLCINVILTGVIVVGIIHMLEWRLDFELGGALRRLCVRIGADTYHVDGRGRRASLPSLP